MCCDELWAERVALPISRCPQPDIGRLDVRRGFTCVYDFTISYPVVIAVSTSEGSIVLLRLACSFSLWSSPSHQDTKTGATPLPVMLVSARTSLMNLSIEKTIAMPGTSAGLTTDSVAASVMKPAPVTPLAPFEVSMATNRMGNCWLNDNSTPSACAMNNVANVI